MHKIQGFRNIRLYLVIVCLVLFNSCTDNDKIQNPVRFIITGNLMGAVKSCKCPNGQPGGLDRRQTIFNELRQNDLSTMTIDCGNPFRKSMSNDSKNSASIIFQNLGYDVLFHDTSEAGNDTIFSYEKLPGSEIQIVNIQNLNNVFLDSAYNEEKDEQTYKGNLVIVGGGGFIEPEVKQVHGKLIVYPGLFGSHVVKIDIWLDSEMKSIKRYEWQAIPTASVQPDPDLNAFISSNF